MEVQDTISHNIFYLSIPAQMQIAKAKAYEICFIGY